MNRLVILSLLVVSAVFGLTEKEYQDSFLTFSRKFSKTYHHDEFQYRYNIFKKNVDYINSYNAQDNGVTLAINQFADLTNTEFKRYLGLKPVKVTPVNDAPTIASTVELPHSLDWRTKGAVTPIKNQLQCGSCWSFSTTGSVEGCHFLGTNKLVALSEQNLMDCSVAQGNEGCDGGLMTDAMTYIIDNGGIDTEASYPYLAEDGTCHYSASNSGSTLTSYVNVITGSESDLQAKAEKGPTSVAIDASQNSFQFYSSGVYYEPACSSTNLDHGVLVVGWGVDNTNKKTPDYWIVKNSWGTDWGLSGYIWMARNMKNNCGIATMATLPQNCK